MLLGGRLMTQAIDVANESGQVQMRMQRPADRKGKLEDLAMRSRPRQFPFPDTILRWPAPIVRLVRRSNRNSPPRYHERRL